MNTVEFFKYQGTGNDFIMVDNRSLSFPKSQEIIERLCHRRFGVGADGLILLEDSREYNFQMVYYNSDGAQSTMCGNGGRCIVAFAHDLGLISSSCRFMAVDGLHHATIRNGSVALGMVDVSAIHPHGEEFILNTGSPHLVCPVEKVSEIEVASLGRYKRNEEPFKKEGINVNFSQDLSPGRIKIRTYERGVEDETFSCGTGATAAALVHMSTHGLCEVAVEVVGGELTIRGRQKTDGSFENIWLEGPAKNVFKGEILV